MLLRWLLVGLAGLSLAGCEKFTAPRYALSADNVVALRDMVGARAAVGEFTEPPKFDADCRSNGPILAADGLGFAAYIRKALLDELRIAGLYAASSPVVLTGSLDRLIFNSSVASWDLTLTVRSSNGRSVTVQEHYRFPGSMHGDIACQRVADALLPAVQNLLQKLIASPDFRSMMYG
jgi:hypothetical protein